MRSYIIGAILEAQGRARTLKGKVKSGQLSVHFNQLEQITSRHIDDVLLNLEGLLSDACYADDQNQRERILEFKKSIGSLDLIENVAVAALARSHQDDEVLNSLMDKIRKEINYPVPAPVVSCLSQQYYSIYTPFNLVCIPLLESDFLLHIPDIFHELAHGILDLDNNPKVEPFQKTLGQFNIAVLQHFKNEIELEGRKTGPEILRLALQNWKTNWIEGWSIELFCDLFGLFTIGPAFAWSHLHLSVKRGRNPFRVPLLAPLTHPPDDARMTSILLGLHLMGFVAEEAAIRAKWSDYLNLCNYRKEPEIDRAFPIELLQKAVSFAHQGTKKIGCRIATPTTKDPIYSLLNDAWVTFWKDPKNYLAWEKEQVILLKGGNKFILP
jgi:hypothetical protein